MVWVADAAQIPIAVAVVQAGSCSSNLTPSLGTSICSAWALKKGKNRKKKKKGRKRKRNWPVDTWYIHFCFSRALSADSVQLLIVQVGLLAQEISASLVPFVIKKPLFSPEMGKGFQNVRLPSPFSICRGYTAY